MQLTELYLSGFQVFDKPTRIPISKLTLLFGPNSAGKSAIEDAIITLQNLISGEGEIDKSTWSRVDMQIKNWRRLSDNPQKIADVMEIGETFAVKSYIQSGLISELNENCGFDLNSNDSSYISETLSVKFAFHVIPDEEDEQFPELRASRNLFFSLDGIEIIKHLDGKLTGVNISHPVFTGIDLSSLFSDQLSSIRTDNHILYVKDGWIVCDSTEVLLDDDHNFNLDLLIFGLEYGGDLNYQRNDESLNAKLILFKRVFDFFVNNFKGMIKSNPSFQLVNASRKVPDDNDLVFFIDSKKFREDPTLKLFNLIELGDEQYWYLAKSCALKSGVCINDELEDEDVYLIDKVNRALTDHLFIDKGYSIGFDYRVLLNPDEFEALQYGEVVSYPVLIKLFLQDPDKRIFSFNDVGTGLGYVLPVLTKILSDSGDDVLVQQPELHLHPALQASLADVFIEATEPEYKRIIVETHSEHFLLRLLKRIRQTSNNTKISSELALLPEDVSVLYFDPKPNGTTTVKRLRISNNGEFMDRWPRGFFAERDQELFDE